MAHGDLERESRRDSLKCLGQTLIVTDSKQNRNEVESAAQYSREQRLTSRLMKPEELFAENSLKL